MNVLIHIHWLIKVWFVDVYSRVGSSDDIVFPLILIGYNSDNVIL